MPNGFVLHVEGDAGDVEVWFDTEAEKYDGFVIGTGATLHAACDDAIQTLAEAILEVGKQRREAKVEPR
jgi:hypothetical protein